MDGWELGDPVAMFRSGDGAKAVEFCRSFHLAATNPEASAMVVVRKYHPTEDRRPDEGPGGFKRGFRVGLAVFDSKNAGTFQLPALRTYLSLSIVGDPAAGDDKIVIETDLGVAVTSSAELVRKLPGMSAGPLEEGVLEEAFESL